jgi:hypothetical protein
MPRESLARSALTIARLRANGGGIIAASRAADVARKQPHARFARAPPSVVQINEAKPPGAPRSIFARENQENSRRRTRVISLHAQFARRRMTKIVEVLCLIKPQIEY